MSPQQTKVLRVGVIRAGKIVEEKLLQPRQGLTIGSAPRNTVVVSGAGVPATLPVFAWQGDRYVLFFGKGAEGRIQGTQGEADLAGLVSQGLAGQQSGSYVVPVREDQRGKLVLGELTVLWQFVTPPPEAPRTLLPREAKGNHFQSMDRLFTIVLAVSFLLHGGFWAALAFADVPEQRDVSLDEIPDRIVRAILPEKKPDLPQPQTTPDVVAETKPEPEPDKKTEGEKKPESAEQTAQRKAAHSAAVAKAVQQKGILKVLGALGPGGGGKGAVADVFGAGGSGTDVASALAGAGGVAVATDPSAGGGGRKGGGQGGAASIGGLATSGGGNAVGYGTKGDAKVSGSVSTEGLEVDSADIDQGKLGSFIRARKGAINACYENSLKRNPSLRGKIVLRFTILETGGIADVSVISNGLGSPDVAQCIMNMIRAWRTPFRPAGSSTVEFPLTFSSAN
jgi:outer membrane biosynthesis protein TonB